MKCDELKGETIVPQGSAITLQMYGKAEVDAAIAELKAENAELKKKCEAEKSIGATFSENGAELARWVEELKQKLEDAQATAYAESVDAGMRERRLKRALWIARAERAEARKKLLVC